MKCFRCDGLFSPSNISRLLFPTGTAKARAPQRHASGPANSGSGMTQVAKAVEHLGMFFFTTETPFQRIESPPLHAAFNTLDAKLPTCQALAGSMLERSYNAVKATVDEQRAQQVINYFY